MSQFKGISTGQIELAYFTGYKRNINFIPMGSEQEAQLIGPKRHGIRLQQENPKRRKVEETSAVASSNKVVDVGELEESTKNLPVKKEEKVKESVVR